MIANVLRLVTVTAFAALSLSPTKPVDETPAPLATPSPTPDPTDARMVRLPGGTFFQGHLHAHRQDESPPHAVVLSPFSIDATLVTRADFAAFVDATHYLTSAEKLGYGMGASEGMADWEWEHLYGASWRRPFRDENHDTADFLRDDAPVVMVSARDAVAYCSWRGARLPTEAEWEYAMRAGAGPESRYPWGDAPERAGGRGPRSLGLNFFQGTSHLHNLREDGFVYVSPVRAYPPNAWGIYDPVGNVWQWTSDGYDAHLYERLAQHGTTSDPHVDARDRDQVLRGGSWWCGACTCEGNGLFYRGKAPAGAPFNNNGFRCAR